MGKFKRWILRKTHSLSGVNQLKQPLEQTHELLRALASSPPATGQVTPLPASSLAQPRVSSDEAVQLLANDGLFVLGCARSGTTILTRCLNRASEVMLLEEPCFFLHEEIADFVRYFDDRPAG